MSLMRTEKIDDIRRVLGWENRGVVSMTMLRGIMDWPNWPAGILEYRETGDTMFVIAGPSEKLNAVLRLAKDDSGLVTVEFSFDEGELHPGR